MYAYPHKGYVEDENGVFGEAQFAGMELRDHFAGLAMQAFVNAWVATKNYPNTDSEVAMLSYKLADAMIEERKQ